MFATKMNNKLPLYSSPIPDPNVMPVGALNILWDALDGYAYCPIALIPKLEQNDNLCLPNNSSGTRVARNELVLGPNRPFHKTTTAPTTLENLLKQSFSQKIAPKSA